MGQQAFPWIVPSPIAGTVVPPNLGTQPIWVRVGTPTFASFSAAATTNAIVLFSLPSGALIHGVKQSIVEPFAGLMTYTVSVGDANIANLYSSAFDVTQAANSFQLSSDFAGESLASATSIYATALCTGGNLSAATAGSVSIFALLSRVL